MIFFQSIVEDCYYNSLASVAHFPGGHDVQIEAILGAAVLLEFSSSMLLLFSFGATELVAGCFQGEEWLVALEWQRNDQA